MTVAGAVVAVVRPLVFTDRLDEVRDELAGLGLRPREESIAGGWVDLAGEGGLVALHSAAGADQPTAEGETWLSFEVADADAAADRLRAAGFGDALVADEAYGREVRVATPDAGLLRIAEVKHDRYGFRGDRSVAGSGVVLAEVPTGDPAGWEPLLGALGLDAGDDGVSFGDRRSGIVRLVPGRPTAYVGARLRVVT